MTVTVPTSAATGFDETSTLANGTTIQVGKHDLANGACIFDLATALNYGQGSGAAQMLRWLTEHTELVHSPPYADWGCNATIGSTSAIDMALRMLTRRGDALLTEAYTFPTAVEAAAPLGLLTVGVDMDREGIVPSALREVLEGWDETARGAKRPRVIYLVPTGQNPTGATMGLERKREVYRICQGYDLFILEDEPYYFLQMPEYGNVQSGNGETSLSHEAFLKSLTPSLLSMDVDGRVLRMDSFSKVVAPGSRMGWITGPEQIVERYKMHTDCSTQGPSGFSQLLMFKLLDVHWGHGGYLDWLKHIRKEYTARRDVIVQACERHLPKEVVRWAPPRAGMFVSPYPFSTAPG
jgi:aromatic amino acid aminotransferase I / 2-aminoadipate transaminase